MLDLSAYLTEIKNRDPRVGVAIQNIQDAVNQLGTATGCDPTAHTEAPNPPAAINVASGSDHVHVTLTDNAQRSRAQNYFLEWSVNDPDFLAPNVEHLGAGRGRVMALPAKDGNNNPINYYFRGYSHALGAKSASKKVVFGGTSSPTAVTLTGSSTLNLLPSTGSGTSPSNGQKPGTGFGTPQFAQAAGRGPKPI
jgi:hypothetical protein